MKVSDLRERLNNLEGDVEVRVILNDYGGKDIKRAYFSIGYDCFTIHI